MKRCNPALVLGLTLIGRANDALKVLQPFILGLLDLLEVIIVGMLPQALEQRLRGGPFGNDLRVIDSKSDAKDR